MIAIVVISAPVIHCFITFYVLEVVIYASQYHVTQAPPSPLAMHNENIRRILGKVLL